MDDLNEKYLYFSTKLPIYNDNNACVLWSKVKTTEGLRHIQMRENAIRELQAIDFVDVQHIGEAINLSDMYTKENKDVNRYIDCRDATIAYPSEYDTQLTDDYVTMGGHRNNIPLPVEKYGCDPQISDVTNLGLKVH